MKPTGWSRTFHEPIVLPDGGKLETLRDAGRYIAALPAAIQQRREWQAAAEALLLVAGRGGDTMLARIGVMRALNSGRPAPQTTRRKAVKSYRIIR